MDERDLLISKYHVGGTLNPNSATYIERKADAEFYEALKSGEFCYVFNSRQMGKTSLCARTKLKLEKYGIDCVYIPATRMVEQAQMTPEEWYRGIIRLIVKGLNWSDFNDEEWWLMQTHFSTVNRFSNFIEDILINRISDDKGVIIIIDEIERVLNLKFNLDSFFAVIRDCYNDRAIKSSYSKLTFGLVGVTTPSDLIRDKNSTPFNIAKAINLTGFQLYEALPLSQGLVSHVKEPNAVLREILDWTGGQPFLTQKLCQIVKDDDICILAGHEKQYIMKLVETKIINNWEYQDEPQHLRSIRDRLLSNEERAGRFLEIYKKILIDDSIPANDSLDQIYLRLSGLVTKRENRLVIYNKIYRHVFNIEWVSELLKNIIRPYAKKMELWKNSDKEDQTNLLYGKELDQMQKWFDKVAFNLGEEDYNFFAESRALDQNARFVFDLEMRSSVIDTVMSWTNGNKGLNLQIFLFLSQQKNSHTGFSRERIDKFIKNNIIKKWETETAAKPLRDLKNEILRDRIDNFENVDCFWLLLFYRKIIKNREIEADDSQEQMKLLELGIILKKDSKLRVCNRIYEYLFNLEWVETELAYLRPYAEKFIHWLDSNCEDKSQLLSKEERMLTQKWFQENNIDLRNINVNEDKYFIDSIVWKG